eukprot:CAMPEP_0194311602 /NCGR_PEP_ID=MMETSP0171-20130528/8525_1 /TAXON_ID=218684 /ORGANISM="Corethron pennatum, Strain L29A3" /LENGTH=120 /DNA_ID=CAMNT_0039065729 /DNA_START=207 /DNA_END=569 /DNA_ORIENTATION=+
MYERPLKRHSVPGSPSTAAWGFWESSEASTDLFRARFCPTHGATTGPADGGRDGFAIGCARVGTVGPATTTQCMMVFPATKMEGSAQAEPANASMPSDTPMGMLIVSNLELAANALGPIV